MIREAGGQFCKREKGATVRSWSRYAREKVSAYFRDMLATNTDHLPRPRPPVEGFSTSSASPPQDAWPAYDGNWRVFG
jgi:hypothetical protein